MSRWAMLGLLATVVGGCGGSRDRVPSDDAGGVPADASVERDAGPGADGAAPPADGASPDLDAGAVTVQCSNGNGPIVVVTRDVAGSTDDLALLRIPLWFSGAASGISITSVRQLDAAEGLVRDWLVSTLAPPSGFDGHAVPRDGYPNPLILFTATAPATMGELALCEGAVTVRAGAVEITGVANEGVPLAVRCGLGLAYGGRGPEQLPLRCARGVPGWLENISTNITQVTAPIVATLVESIATVHGVGAAPIDTFVSSAGTVSGASAPDGFDPACFAPVEWSTMGRNNLWRGMTSEAVWSGPVAPGTEETVWWWSQSDRTVPEGTCAVPDMGMPGPSMCTPPVTRLVLRGTSSAGAWEWETGIFTCYQRW